VTRVAAALLALAVLVTGIPQVGAQPAGDDADEGGRDRGSAAKNRAARAHFLRAEKAFNLAKFTEALAAYEAAYEIRPLPALLFNIAQCHRNLGDHERAIFFYRRYITLEPRSKNREVVLDLIAEQEQEQERDRVARVPLATPVPPPAPPPTVPLGPAEAADRSGDTPLYRRWWVWAVAGAVAVGVTAALLYPRQGPLPRGQLDSVDRR
jgi:tetratricopeptide (TPR) repeat protein